MYSAGGLGVVLCCVVVGDSTTEGATEPVSDKALVIVDDPAWIASVVNGSNDSQSGTDSLCFFLYSSSVSLVA